MKYNIKYNEDTTIKDIKDSLSASAHKCLDLPDYAQFNDKLVSMVNYLPLLENVIEALKPSHICEIGSYKGMTTSYLVKKTRKLGVKLSVVDPIIDPKNFYTDQKHVFPHSKLSVDYLKDAEKAEIYFIDGDHNYETVSAELELISNMLNDDDITCLFMHDTGWPLAYRDSYYNPKILKKPHQYVDGCYLSPFESQISDNGHYFASGFYVAKKEGISDNGVRPAIENFINKSKWRWHSAYIPSISGLSVLWRENGLDNKQRKVLEDLRKLFNDISCFLSILEINRLHLLEIIQSQSILWKKQQQYISIIEKRNRQQQEAMVTLENHKRDRQAEIEKLNKELDESGRLWLEQQQVIEALENHKKDKQAEIEKLNKELDESGRLWLEQQQVIEAVENHKKDKQAEIEKLNKELDESGRLWLEQQRYISNLKDNLKNCKADSENWRQTIAFKLYSKLSRKN